MTEGVAVPAGAPDPGVPTTSATPPRAASAVAPDAAAHAGHPAASVIIPNWNGARFLPTCLEALRRQSFCDFEVVVVDNGSTDASLAVLADAPEVRVVRLPTNLGFAGGVNAGIRAARGEVVVLLNNDTEADPDWLGALMGAVTAEPAIGMAASKVRLFDRRDTLHTTGDTLDLAGCPGNRGVWEVDRGQYDAARDVFGPNGAAAAYRRTLIDQLDGFDEAFGSYMEDVDLAWRARLAGWRCVYAPGAIVYHHLSATGGGPLASYLVARNRIWLIARNYPTRLFVRHCARVVSAQLRIAALALRAWRGAAARATLRGQFVGALTWPRMWAERRRIQAGRVMGDEELERWMMAGER